MSQNSTSKTPEASVSTMVPTCPRRSPFSNTSWVSATTSNSFMSESPQNVAAGLVTYGFRPDRFQVLPERPAPYGDLRDEQHSNNNRALSRFRPPLSCHWATSRFEQLSVSQAPSE